MSHKEVVRTIGNYDRDRLSEVTGLLCTDPSLAVQSQKDEADINVIVENFGVTGKITQPIRLPEYGDFTGVNDYATAIAAVREAEAAFMALPAAIRDRMDNDPALFVAFCEDPSNLAELRKLGLANPLPPDPPADPSPTA